MTQEPRTQDEIYRSVRDRLTSSIAGLTNFTERSFNYIFTQAYATQLRELELQAVASQLSGYIDYADGNLTEDDLRELGIDAFVDDPAEINQYMSDDNLDELVSELGVTRRGGDFATGEAEFTTQAARTVIPEGTVVTTELDSAGESLQFETTEELIVPEGITDSREVTIQALDSGEEYNLPEGSIIRVQSPPVGVTGVINTNQTSGGTDIETNDELRARAKQAVPSSSLGGTETGIRAFIRQNVAGVEEGDIIIDEIFDATPSFVDVIVDGGTDSDVTDAIESSRPTGIQHNLVRPETITVGVESSLMGTGFTTDIIETEISDYLGELNIGENFFRNELVRTILNADANVLNVEKLDAIIESVTEEKIVYDASVDTYQLDFTYDDTYGDITVEDKSGTLYIEGEDFVTIDDSGDGYTDSIQWTTSSPSDGEQFSVSYDVTVIGETLEQDYYTASDVRDEPIQFNLNEEYEFEYQDTLGEYDLPSRPFDGTITVIEVDETGTQVGDEFVRGESWQLAALKDDGSADTFTFDNTESVYQLTDKVSGGGFSITDETGAIYRRGTDYTVIDTDSDSVLDAINWNTEIDRAVADDGGTLTDETTAATNDTTDDMSLLPTSPATGDAYYIGNSEQFDTFDLTVSTAGAGDWTIVWEYYDGSSWSALDGVSDGTNGFTAGGTNTVTWDTPTDWSEETVDGNELFWIRARVDTFGSITTQPLGREVLFGESPENGEQFTVNYGCCTQTIQWDQTGDEPTPTNGGTVQVTFDQQVYETEYEIVEAKENTIKDENGDVYDEGDDYVLFDATGDNEDDSIFWLQKPSTLSDGETFYFSYVSEGDIFIGDREKVSPGNITVE